MNKKIKALAKQAQQYAECTTPQGLEWLPAFKEKFAELIVKECADVCESFGESGDGYTCSAEILEHFGVEV